MILIFKNQYHIQLDGPLTQLKYSQLCLRGDEGRVSKEKENFKPCLKKSKGGIEKGKF